MTTRLLNRGGLLPKGWLSLCTAAVCLSALAACGPKAPEVTNYPDYACQQAQVAQASAEANMQQYEALVAEIAQREAAKVELERLRSRIRTNRITDLELAEWRREQERARLAAIADTARADTTATEMPEQAPGAESTATDTLMSGEAASVDTTSMGQPEEVGLEEGASDTSGASEPFGPQEEPSSEGVEPSEVPGTSSADEGAETETFEAGTQEASPAVDETSPAEEPSPAPDETTPQPGETTPEQSGDASTQSQPEMGADEEGWTTTTEEEVGD
jgi:predicted small lipoprotein YifL